MIIELSNTEKEQLEIQHKTERDRRVADRIKAVLLNTEGWSQKQIAQALRIRYETVQDHLNDYKKLKKLKPENGGSKSQLSFEQTEELIQHLETNTYLNAGFICAYVDQNFGVKFTVSGMTKWLLHNNFSYKKPKGTPAKADPEKQKEFIVQYQKLLNETPEDEPIEFADAVHPTMATKVTQGWIRKGTNKPIATTASKTRVNLLGSINLETMNVTIAPHETIDGKAMRKHFKSLRKKYPKALKIHLITDRGSYNVSAETKKAAHEFGIILHPLPPYSPNLNPIERLWKVMNEQVRNNRVFKNAQEFRKVILEFFTHTWPKIALSMTDRINDNFQTLKKVSSG
ncbi:MAG: IS630 family transposase [Candidatus Omnitrophica bacterium]|nr:IS630 family transposase [Candidatus Omnitrophota bacterium]